MPCIHPQRFRAPAYDVQRSRTRSNGDAKTEKKVIVVGGHRSIVVGRNLAHFTAFDAFEAAFAGFFAQEAAAQGGDTRIRNLR